MNAKPGLVGSAILLLAASTSLSQPIVTQQPTNQSVSLKANVTFRVTATGAAPLSYQWRFDAVDLAQCHQPQSQFDECATRLATAQRAQLGVTSMGMATWIFSSPTVDGSPIKTMLFT